MTNSDRSFSLPLLRDPWSATATALAWRRARLNTSIQHYFLVLERPPYCDERHLLQVREVPFGVGRVVR
jgi:hypothetical protein